MQTSFSPTHPTSVHPFSTQVTIIINFFSRLGLLTSPPNLAARGLGTFLPWQTKSQSTFVQRTKSSPSSWSPLINFCTHLCRHWGNDICSCQDAPSWHRKMQPCPCSQLCVGWAASWHRSLLQSTPISFAGMVESAHAMLWGQPWALQVTLWTCKSCCSSFLVCASCWK